MGAQLMTVRESVEAYVERGGTVKVCRPWNTPYRYQRTVKVRKHYVMPCFSGPKGYPECPIATMAKHAGNYNGIKYTVSRELS